MLSCPTDCRVARLSALVELFLFMSVHLSPIPGWAGTRGARWSPTLLSARLVGWIAVSPDEADERLKVASKFQSCCKLSEEVQHKAWAAVLQEGANTHLGVTQVKELAAMLLRVTRPPLQHEYVRSGLQRVDVLLDLPLCLQDLSPSPLFSINRLKGWFPI